MRDIPVAAHHHVAPAGFQLRQYRVKRIQKFVFVGLALFRAGAAGQIQRNHAQIAEIGADKAAFLIKLFQPQSDVHRIGHAFAVNGHAAVTAFLGAMPHAVHAVRIFHIVRQISFLRLQFLHADNIRAGLRHVVQKAFFIGRTDAVHICRDNSHVAAFVG